MWARPHQGGRWQSSWLVWRGPLNRVVLAQFHEGLGGIAQET